VQQAVVLCFGKTLMASRAKGAVEQVRVHSFRSFTEGGIVTVV